MQPNQAPTYYTLAELFYQRTVALTQGDDKMVDVLNYEIDLQAAHEQRLMAASRPFDQEYD